MGQSYEAIGGFRDAISISAVVTRPIRSSNRQTRRSSHHSLLSTPLIVLMFNQIRLPTRQLSSSSSGPNKRIWSDKRKSVDYSPCLEALTNKFPASLVFSKLPDRFARCCVMSSIFVPRSSSDTWTITTFFGVLLAQAEVLYGPRVQEHTLLGIQIGLTNRPALCSLDGKNAWYISTRSGLETNMQEALFDVAHEAIHCLGPVSTATVLEEGLAVHFSLNHAHPSVPSSGKTEADLPPDYAEALRLFNSYRSAGGDIRGLREQEP